MNRVKKILIAVDFGLSSEKAVRFAAMFASSCQASVRVLHVIDVDYAVSGAPYNPEEAGAITGKLAEYSREIQQFSGHEAGYSVLYGTVTHQILKEAMAFCADLIIIGKTGTHPSSNEYAGNHVSELVEKSPMPVLLIPSDSAPGEIRTVLFPVRPQKGMLEKYELVKGMISSQGARLTVLCKQNPGDQRENGIIHQLIRILGKRVADDRLVLDQEYYFQENDFADRLLYFMVNRPHDLAVITAERVRQGGEFHLSPFVQSVIHRCTIPTIICPVNAEESEDTGGLVMELKNIA